MVCDASLGLAPVVDAENGVLDPFLAIGTVGDIKLPISLTTVPPTCGQSALQSNGFTYVTQAVVDTKDTSSTAVAYSVQPLIRIRVHSLVRQATSRLQVSMVTSRLRWRSALYVGFLKSGNIMKIVNRDPAPHKWYRGSAIHHMVTQHELSIRRQ